LFLAACGGEQTPCVPKSCAELAIECGDALDNCQKPIRCPACPQDKQCQNNRCVVVSDPSQPLYAASGVYSTTIQPTGEAADVYYPAPPDLATGNYRFPWALLVQGAYVDKQYYADFASRVARYGIVVVVPNTANLFPGENIIEIAAAHMSSENGAGSPIAGKLDLDTMFLLGHSQGGLCSVVALSDKCSMWTGCTCTQPFSLPAACKGGVFYGTFVLGAVPNNHRPIALVQGSVDGKCKPSQSLSTYQGIADPPKAYVTVNGANHYGICNQNNPPGAQRDNTALTIDQGVAVETIARWSALFLRGAILGEAGAYDYVFRTGDNLDPNVTVQLAP